MSADEGDTRMTAEIKSITLPEILAVRVEATNPLIRSKLMPPPDGITV